MKRAFLALSLVACGAEPPPRPVVARATLYDAGPQAPAPIDAGDPLAVDPASIAPGMREIVRSEIAVSRDATSIAVPISSEADTCVRVAVRSLSPVRVKLAAKSGLLGEGTTIGERGPMCVRKGDALSLELSADEPARARVFVWSSP
jgi:hypothetical protein